MKQTFGYTVVSTVLDRYSCKAKASGEYFCRESMVRRIDSTLKAVTDWGNAKLVRVNATKMTICISGNGLQNGVLLT